MKQHITNKQLEELTQEKQVEFVDLLRYEGNVLNLFSEEDISIGSMIEFINTNSDKELTIWRKR